MAYIWTQKPELVGEVIRRWNDGDSMSQIALALGNGLTRNAVGAKLDRLRAAGVDLRSTAPRKTEKQRPFVLPLRHGIGATPAKTKAAPTVEKPDPIGPLSFEDGSFVTSETVTDRHCHYPFGEVGPDFKYCGRAIHKGSFCEEHWKRTHQPKHPATQEIEAA